MSVFFTRFYWNLRIFRKVIMAILKNKTQKNFTMISNNILHDRELSTKDRGVLCTLCSLPDGWDFSIAGLSAIVPDGTSSIRASIENLEKLGYLTRTKTRDTEGHFTSTIEIFTEKRKISEDTRERKPVTDNPSREIHDGYSATEKQPQYNTQNIKYKDNTKINIQSHRSNTYHSSGKTRNQFNNFPQRNDYDFEELEKKLVKN